MKLVKLMSIALAATSLGSVATVAAPTMNAQAKAKMTLKTIPKQFRGTWYHYEKKSGYDYVKLSATKRTERITIMGLTNKRTVTMHQFDLNKGNKIGKNPHKWMYAYKQGKAYVMSEWGTHASDRENYVTTTRKYKGQTVKVIKATYPMINSQVIYSPSKAMAKQLWNLDNK
ncbi:hypothetical protein [Lactiplantibacillus daowaiensis]|uniref:Extracellular protein n=1 Tax=Lactiplantibacillus daowaiensis TaxID=2559918 RepID=A0ABW1RWN1_9LACO|nr:hypothetical protein [Lactiplantibacillus daowaiensis]